MTTWTNPRTVALNDPFPASQWNNEVKGNLNYLKDRLASSHGTSFPSSASVGDRFAFVSGVDGDVVEDFIYTGDKWVTPGVWARELIFRGVEDEFPTIAHTVYFDQYD